MASTDGCDVFPCGLAHPDTGENILPVRRTLVPPVDLCSRHLPLGLPQLLSPKGPTRFVSHISLPDTLTQVRLVSLQGTAVYKHFTSNQHVYVHTNPRLDLCVIHAEQSLKRSGEMKMMWMQNEGYIIRPRLEIVEELQVGDHVWIYGMSAHESLFDEEKAPEPLMIPTGVRAIVKAKTREHFFLDTRSLEGEQKGTIHMGMCGSVIMRNGKCVGMLTATVHDESPTKELAGCAMATYSKDIFEFLLEVEKQMLNPIAPIESEDTQFMTKRKEEGIVKEYKDWELDHSRTARHIPVPSSLWHMEESWMTEEDFMTSHVFGRSGVFNQETQESTLGYDMNSSKSYGDRPGDIAAYSNVTSDGKVPVQGQRKDYYPEGVYAEPESFKTKDVWDYDISSEMRSLFDRSVEDKEASSLNSLRQSLETLRAQREMEKMKESALRQASGTARDPMKAYGHYGGVQGGGMDNFDPDYSESSYTYEEPEASPPPPPPRRDRDINLDEFFGTPPSRAASASPPKREAAAAATGTSEKTTNPLNENIERKKQERREAEEKYQQELRRRHGRGAIPFGDPDLGGMWTAGASPSEEEMREFNQFKDRKK